ncbi:hypothetical protein VQ056_15525 [Paenibacillus sp. JTLBN-2024]
MGKGSADQDVPEGRSVLRAGFHAVHLLQHVEKGLDNADVRRAIAMAIDYKKYRIWR